MMSASPSLRQCRESIIDLPLIGGAHDVQRDVKRTHRSRQFSDRRLRHWVFRMDEQTENIERRNEIAQQTKPLRGRSVGEKAHAGDIATRPI